MPDQTNFEMPRSFKRGCGLSERIFEMK